MQSLRRISLGLSSRMFSSRTFDSHFAFFSTKRSRPVPPTTNQATSASSSDDSGEENEDANPHSGDRIKIPENRLSKQTMRSSGPGGQSVNKVTCTIWTFFVENRDLHDSAWRLKWDPFPRAHFVVVYWPPHVHPCGPNVTQKSFTVQSDTKVRISFNLDDADWLPDKVKTNLRWVFQRSSRVIGERDSFPTIIPSGMPLQAVYVLWRATLYGISVTCEKREPFSFLFSNINASIVQF
jgi:hypothetical protein